MKIDEMLLEAIKEKLDRGDFRVAPITSQLERAYYALRGGKEFSYEGYDLTELDMLVVVPKVKERLTLEHAQWRKESQGESYLSQILLCALNLGYNAGLKAGRADGRVEALMEVKENSDES